MISKICVENRNINSVHASNPNKKTERQNPSFGCAGLWPVILKGIQECEKNPMINVAVIDMLSAILPRTFVESLTNWFAGFEAFRRESSGLIVNCLIPSGIAWTAAKGLNFMMPKNTKMYNCWADSKLIQKATELYTESQSTDKVHDALKEILSNIEGYHGRGKDSSVVVKNILSPQEIEQCASELKELTLSDKNGKELKKAIQAIREKIIEKTHVYENITVGGKGTKVNASTVDTLLQDTVKFFQQYRKAGSEISISEFAQKSKNLIKSKSILGMAIVLPLAASMQYINRWITKKVSGVEGAPIYEDFGNEQNEEIKQKSKEGLLKQKIISISSMIGVGLLSMMKMPKWNMFEFKGPLPTMDQARVISTTTFASRMAVADDKNELAEATVRDIATFASLYFLGDYAAKGAATIIEKKTGVELLNETKKLDKNANFIQKFWHWMKDVHIKSSEEVVSKTKELLKGAKPNTEQEKTIAKELKKAINLRSACQAANLGVSLLLLGLVIPIFTRKSTKKNHAEDLKIAQEHLSSTNNSTPTGQPTLKPQTV